MNPETPVVPPMPMPVPVQEVKPKSTMIPGKFYFILRKK